MLRNIVRSAVVAGLVVHTSSALAQETPAAESQAPVQQDAPQSEAARIEELDQDLRVLRRKLELQAEREAELKKQTAVLTAGEEGFVLSSGDGQNKLRLRGLLQVDGRAFPGDTKLPLTDSFVARRVRPILDATLLGILDVRFTPDFGDSRIVIYDAYAELRPRAWFKLRVGKFKPPVGLERLQSAANTLFLERAFPTALVPNRDVGAQVQSELLNGAVSLTLGVFDGVADGAIGDFDVNESKDVVARVFVRPFKPTSVEPLQNFGIGIAGTDGRQSGTATATNTPSYKSPGQQTVFSYASDVVANGMRQRLAPQLSYGYGPFGFIGEYTVSAQETSRAAEKKRLTHRSWQGTASVVLTGETASTEGVVPRHAVNFEQGHFGAIELVARYQELRLDPATFPTFADPSKAIARARSGGVGANWYLSRNLRAGLDFDRTWFERGAANGADRIPESSLIGRLQASF